MPDETPGNDGRLQVLLSLLEAVGKPRFNGRSIAVSAVKNGFIDGDRF